ncbi:arylsulfatase [Roseibium alexandrii]|uniref:Arylsulfatase A/related enzyme n=1 Tax=Roseibium alexandrii (strain DSM 17067 / NCIMB 14079 / DFL-11) TaxID=244592 RepID=A0A5E8H3E0_ROSAD|nr:arylsulfatase [Roseibium alexandrii]EEE46611.2 Arylsulfatase A/related enzyme [Roseibium alexandrii DFL-11]
MVSIRFQTINILLCALVCLADSAIADDRPNILLVMADDLGWTDIGPYGGEIETPNLEALAAEGILFTDFHASVSCSPTRAMLMSGNDNHIAGLGTMGEILAPNQVGQPGYEGHLNNRVASIAEVLGAAGYHTYMAGKWHLGHSEGTLPFDRGFDSTFTLLVGGASHWGDRLGILPMDDPALYAENGKLIETLPEDFYSSQTYVDLLIEAIRSNHGDGVPFFGYLAFTAPHDPLQVPEPWLSKYSGRYDRGYEALREERWSSAKALGLVPENAPPPNFLSMIEPWNKLSEEDRTTEARGMEIYAGMVDAMDYHFGRVVDFLGDIGELENTIIVFLSDNGSNPFYSADYPDADDPEFVSKFDHSFQNLGHPGSNYAYGPGFASASSGPIDRFKLTVGEGGIRVPLILSGPGIPEGAKAHAFAYVWDILPTLLDLTGVEYPDSIDGRPILPLRGRTMKPLLNGSSKVLYQPDEFVGGEMNGDKWMRQGGYKAMLVTPPYGDGVWRLYNVVEDPGETRDLAVEMPDLLEKLRVAWDDYAEEVGVVAAE